MQKIESISSFIKESRGTDLDIYHPSFLKSQLSKRIKLTKCANVEEYITYIKHNKDEVDRLLGSLSIIVSWFYRNPINWEILKLRVLPGLIESRLNQGKDILRVWVAGCAEGEEAYTIAILLKEIIEKQGFVIKIQIFATDLNIKALAAAKRGVYNPDAFKYMPWGLMEKYFEKTGSKFKVQSCLKENVHFSTFDLLGSKRQSPPDAIFNEFDIVLCQNVLIYYQKSAKQKMLNKLNHAIAKGSYLVLGESENPTGREKHQLLKISSLGTIYQKY